VQATASVGEVRRGVEATLWAPAGIDPEVVAGRTFVPGNATDDSAGTRERGHR